MSARPVRRYVSPGRLGVAEDAGYSPSADDLAPPARHLMAAPGVDPLTAFAQEMRALRFVGALSRCSHPHCRTSLTEETVTYCGHDLPFCEDCTWEDGCPACDALVDGALAHIDSEGPSA